MFLKIFRSISIIFLLILGILLFRDDFRSYLNEELFRRGVFTKMKELKIPIEEIKTQVRKVSDNLPTPLVYKSHDYSEDVELESNKIITETNAMRIQDGQVALALNSKLKLSAEKKVDDMFKLQYFEHISPGGFGPSDLANQVGYSYLTVGENLALGIFKDEKDLIKAWMDSPGHRANILSSKFTEIGVSAKRGLYKGEMVWMSVQEFGKPLSTCPMPTELEKQTIESYSKTVKDFSQSLDALRKEIEDSSKNNPKYNQMVDEYNDLVKQYNSIIKELDLKSRIYNQKADEFNKCVQENT